MKNNPTVAITKCLSYNIDEVYQAVKKVCLECPFPDVSGKKVLVKPNILSDAPVKNCITTNPEVVRAVIMILKEKGAAEIIVGDSPGLHGSGFKGTTCGIGNVCKEENVEFVDFTKHASYRKFKTSKDRPLITDYAFDADIVFSVCKFKTHQLMYATGAVKNLFGLIPGLNKSSMHLCYPSKQSFARFIVNLHETVKPAFCIMDGIIGMEGPGPANGYPRAVNLILASDSCFACDWAEAQIMGYKPESLPILSEAMKKGLVSKWISYPLLSPEDLVIEDFKRIEIKEKTEFFKTLVLPFFTRSFQKKKQQKEAAPEFNNEKCIRCLRCVNICPAKALVLKDNKIEIDYSKCIRCYCCHEMCPKDAITITKNK